MAMEARAILPIDCWQSIFSHLPDNGLKAVSLVCKDFLALSNICKRVLSVVHPSIRVLSKQLSRFKFLNKIDLKQFRGDIDEALLEIAYSQINLEILDISNQVEFKAESLKALGLNSKMKNLKALNCTSTQRLHDNDIVAIANSFSNLEELNLDFYGYPTRPRALDITPTFVSDDGIEPLASKLKYLKKINLSGFCAITDRSLVALSTNCTFLKSFTMRSEIQFIINPPQRYVTEYGIGFLLRNCPNLEALKIGFIDMDSDSQSTAINIENSIRYAKALTSLEFTRMDVSDMLLSEIAKAKLPLKKFRLCFCEKFTVMGLLKVLSTSNYLTELILSGSNIGDVDMQTILNGSSLVKLTYINISLTRVTLSTLLLLSANCPSLIEIRMGRTNIWGVDSSLELDDIPFPLPNHSIRNLCIRGCEVGDEFLKKFGIMFPNLKVLDVSDLRTSTGTEAILKNCMFIQKLILMGYNHRKLIETDNDNNNSQVSTVNLEDLGLPYSEIDDEGLAGLAKLCPRLVSLNLTGCRKITARGIKYQIVRKITTLNRLYLPHCEGHVFGCESQRAVGCKSRAVLEWMLSTGNFASLQKIFICEQCELSEEQRERFLHHGCLIFPNSCTMDV